MNDASHQASEDISSMIVGGLTIDGPYSADLDDAIEVKRTDRGWTVTIAVANVADDLPTGSLDDLRAHERAATQYAGNRVRESMLPHALVSALSLTPGMDRPCLAFRVELDTDLEVVDFSAERASFRSDGRLAYGDVPRLLRDSGPRGKTLRDALSLAKALRAIRLGRGAVFADDPDDPRGLIGGSHPGELIVSELMILTNAAAASHARDRGLPVLFRNHGPRDHDDPVRLRMTAQTGTMRLDLRDLPIARHRFERAVYEGICTGHMGLGLSAYSHFTSPLRRYPDIVNQRVLLGLAQPDLDAIADELTQKMLAVKLARSEAFKAWDKQKTAKAVATDEAAEDYEALARLDDGAFSRTLKRESHAIGGEGTIDRAIRARLERMGLADLARIVVVGKRGSDVLRAAMERIATNPQDAISVIALGEQQYGLQRSFSHGEGAGGFETEIILNRIGRTGRARETAHSKTAAKQRAHLAALADYAGSPVAIQRNEDRDVGPVENPRGDLDALLQRAGTLRATFKTSANGANGAGGFASIATARLNDGDEAARGTGPTVKAAERAAAGELLKLLRARNDDVGPRNVERETDAECDAVSELNASAQREEISLPVYKFEPIGMRFRCIATIERQGHTLVGAGIGNSKKAAKKKAARDLLERLTSPIQCT